MQGTTADLLKDIITIFYSPLAQVYKAASIADSIGDLQSFVTDLIKTVEQVDEGRPSYLVGSYVSLIQSLTATQDDPQRTVKIFVDLIQRHEQSFYSFVHKVHSKGESLFTGLMQWIELFLTLAREGLSPEPVSLEFLLPHAGAERAEILREVDSVALYHYKLKVAYEERLRRRFGRSQEGRSEADAEDEAAQALVHGVVDELSFGELMQGEAMDAAAEDTESESGASEDDSSSDEDDGSSTDAYETAEENEKAAAARVKAKAPARANTVGHGAPPSPTHERRSQNSGREKPAGSASSVRSSRSMNFKHRPRVSTKDVPPVPSVRSPVSSVRSPVSPRKKGFPQSPSRQQRYRSQSRRRGEDANGKDKSARRKRQPAEEIKPPELHHIPNLLPVFIEMVSFARRLHHGVSLTFVYRCGLAFSLGNDDICLLLELFIGHVTVL